MLVRPADRRDSEEVSTERCAGRAFSGRTCKIDCRRKRESRASRGGDIGLW